MSDKYETVKAAADKYGVPVEALLAIGNIESGFNSAADNPFSSASGAFQFTDSTAREYGLTGDKRNNLAAQADAAARMAAKNSKALASTLGRAPSAGELYLAHQQGLAGARALLLNPDRPAAEVLDRFHGGNGASVVRKNGGNAGMTAGDFAGKWVNKGNQVASRIPPGEIPSVGTLTDTVPRVAPAPITPLPNTAAMRGMTSPTGGNTGLQTALDRVATRERNRVIPQMPPIRSVETVASYPTTPLPPRQRGDLTAPGGVNSYVGGMRQDANLAAALAGRRSFNGDPMTPSNGPVVASFPSRPPAITPQTQRAAGDVAQMRRANNAATDYGDGWKVVSNSPASGVGQPPATRSVQTQAIARLPQLKAPAPIGRPPVPSNLAAARNEQGIQRSVAPPVTRAALPQMPMPPRGGSSVLDDYAYNTRPNMPRVNANAPDRLAANAGLPEMFGNARVNGVGTKAVAVNPFDRPASPQFAALPSPAPQMPQMPRPRPAGGGGQFGVGTALDVAPLQSLPSLPTLAKPISPMPEPFIGGFDPSLIRRYPIGSTAPIGSMPGTAWPPSTGTVVIKPQQQNGGFMGGFQLPGIWGLAQKGLGAMGFRPQMPSMPQAGGRGSGTVFGGGFLSGGRKQTSAVQAQVDAGYSPSEAYDRANTAAVERAIAGAANPDQARRLNQSLGNI